MLEQKNPENRRLRKSTLLDCDDAKIVTLIWEVRDDVENIRHSARVTAGRSPRCVTPDERNTNGAVPRCGCSSGGRRDTFCSRPHSWVGENQTRVMTIMPARALSPYPAAGEAD